MVFLSLFLRTFGWYSTLNCGKTASFHNLTVIGGCSRQCELLRASFNKYRSYLTSGYDSCLVPDSIIIVRWHARARVRVCVYVFRYSDSLQAQWSVDRIPVGGEIFRAHP